MQSLNVRQEKRLVTKAKFCRFSRFGVKRPKLPLGQTLNHGTCDDYYTDNVMDTEVNCLAVSSKRVKRFEGKLNIC